MALIRSAFRNYSVPASLAAFLVVTVLSVLSPATAHHPGENLDAVMGNKETYFQMIDKAAPAFALRDQNGAAVDLADYAGKIVVLNFIYAHCPDVCPPHSEKIAEVQAMINESPMKSMVQFVSITTDPANDTPDLLASYGPDHGLDSENWIFLTTKPGQSDDMTRALAQAYGHKFTVTAEGFQTHGIVTHVIDRGGRWAANFHGLKFGSVNLVLYINGLINHANLPKNKREPGLLDKMKGLLE